MRSMVKVKLGSKKFLIVTGSSQPSNRTTGSDQDQQEIGRVLPKDFRVYKPRSRIVWLRDSRVVKLGLKRVLVGDQIFRTRD